MEFQIAKMLVTAVANHTPAEEVYPFLPEEVKPQSDFDAFCLDILGIRNAFGLPLTLCFNSRAEMETAQLVLHSIKTQGYRISFTFSSAYCSAI